MFRSTLCLTTDSSVLSVQVDDKSRVIMSFDKDSVYKCNFLTSGVYNNFSRKTLYHGVGYILKLYELKIYHVL